MSICDSALQLASLGWPIVLLHSHRQGICTCSRGKDCPSPGKHPRLTGWQHQATSDEATLCGLFQRFPESNIGIRLGAIVDIEYDNPQGEATTNELLSDCFTPTWQSSRGKHRLFLSPGILQTKVDFRGLEIRLAGNSEALQSVVPPSIHASGLQLHWLPGLDPFSVEPQPVPQALLEAIQPQNIPELCFEVEDNDFRAAAGAEPGQRQPKLARMALA